MIHVKKSLLTTSAMALAVTVVASPAQARTEVHPYLEVGQVVTANLSGAKDVLTYSTVAGGVDASASGPRAEFQVNYRYERRIGYSKRLRDSDVHSGLARGRLEVVPNLLQFEAGAIATRARSDIRGSAPTLLNGNVDNVSQVYSVYAGPTLATQVGRLNVGAAYRIGYTKVNGSNFTPVAGQPAVDNFSHSVSHSLSGNVGMSPGELPFGWNASAAYNRTDSGQLDQRFESKGAQLAVVVPITPSIAALGDIGYEKITASQRDAVRDVNGIPVVGPGGRFQTDPTSPRLLAYNQSGLYWDVGVAYRPSRRTNLEARVGRRYGSLSFTGSLSHQLNEDSIFQVGVYDQVQTFGQQLTNGLAALPTSFNVSDNPLAPQFGGCTFSGNGNSAGGCLNSTLGSINSSVYRARGVNAQLSMHRGRWTAGAGLGYTQRKFQAPTVGTNFTVNGSKDQSYFGQANVGYTIDEQSSVDAEVFASLYDSGILGAPNVQSVGATGAYHRQFGRRLSGTAALGVYSNKVVGQQSNVTGSALVGMRYTF